MKYCYAHIAGTEEAVVAAYKGYFNSSGNCTTAFAMPNRAKAIDRAKVIQQNTQLRQSSEK
jgi:hypothetical protein